MESDASSEPKASAARAVPSSSDGRRLAAVLLLAALAIGGSLAVRAILHRQKLRSATAAAAEALGRDTYGGYRDVDLALRELVTPGSTETALAAERAYALAQLSASYGDDQAGVESELLLLPLERAEAPSARVYAARALLLLGKGEPGSALLAAGRASEGETSAELEAVRARIAQALERPDLAQQAIAAALLAAPKLVVALRAKGDLARARGQFAQAVAAYDAALAENPRHVSSLLALGQMAERGQAGEPARQASELERELPLFAAEGSPGEQCEALATLARLDLRLGHALAASSHLDRAGALDDAPAACRVELARLDRRLGRDASALALLRVAVEDDDPGEAPLVLAEWTPDSKEALDWATRPPPTGLPPRLHDQWIARAGAAELQARLSSGDRNGAQLVARRLEGIEDWHIALALARLRGSRAEARLVEEALRWARATLEAGDALTSIGEAALSLRLNVLAAEACEGGAAHGDGNLRALLCAARALHAAGKDEAARAMLDRAAAIDPGALAVDKLRGELAAALPPTPGKP
ncbi:MAG: hypothetical protein ACYCWW_04315 [Deltaproteobacteria bacterium]